MCGIVGFTGKEQAAPILLEGLSKLEYRGYDSAGIAVRDGDRDVDICELPEIFRLKFAPQPQLWCILVYSVVSLSVSSTFRKSIISS
jgi:asparagine synthetase B (glutamine-hydrolysing)